MYMLSLGGINKANDRNNNAQNQAFPGIALLGNSVGPFPSRCGVLDPHGSVDHVTALQGLICMGKLKRTEAARGSGYYIQIF